MKQTAVEWLAEQVKSTKWAFADVTDRNTIIEQAKQMEREQMVDFAKRCDITESMLSEDYYIEKLAEAEAYAVQRWG